MLKDTILPTVQYSWYIFTSLHCAYVRWKCYLLQRHNTEHSKQIFPEKELGGASPVPISTFMCLWAIYIFPVCLFCCRKIQYVDRFWEYINHSQTHECESWDWGRLSFSGNTKILAWVRSAANYKLTYQQPMWKYDRISWPSVAAASVYWNSCVKLTLLTSVSESKGKLIGNVLMNRQRTAFPLLWTLCLYTVLTQRCTLRQ